MKRNNDYDFDTKRVDHVATFHHLQDFIMSSVCQLKQHFECILTGGFAYQLIYKDLFSPYTHDLDVLVKCKANEENLSKFITLITEQINQKTIEYTQLFDINDLTNHPELRCKHTKMMIHPHVCVAVRYCDDVIGTKLLVFVKQLPCLKKIIDIRGLNQEIVCIMDFKFVDFMTRTEEVKQHNFRVVNKDFLTDGFRLSFQHKLKQLEDLQTENNPILYPIVRNYQCRLHVLYDRLHVLDPLLAQHLVNEWQILVDKKFPGYTTTDHASFYLFFLEKCKERVELFTKHVEKEKERKKIETEQKRRQEQSKKDKEDKEKINDKSGNVGGSVGESVDVEKKREKKREKKKRKSPKNSSKKSSPNKSSNNVLDIDDKELEQIIMIAKEKVEKEKKTEQEKIIKKIPETDTEVIMLINIFTMISLGKFDADNEECHKTVSYMLKNEHKLVPFISKLNYKQKEQLEQQMENIANMAIMCQDECLFELKHIEKRMNYNTRPRKDVILRIITDWWTDFYKKNTFINLMRLLDVFTKVMKTTIASVFPRNKVKNWDLSLYLYRDIEDMNNNREHLISWMSCKIKFVMLYIKQKLFDDVNNKSKTESQSQKLFHNFLDIFNHHSLFDRQSNYIQDNESFYNRMLKHSEYLLTFNNMKLQGLESLMNENIWVITKDGEEELNIYFKKPDEFLYSPNNMILINQSIENCREMLGLVEVDVSKIVNGSVNDSPNEEIVDDSSVNGDDYHFEELTESCNHVNH